MKNDAVILNKLNIYGNILPGISKHMAVICCVKFPDKYKSISNNKSIVKTFLKAHLISSSQNFHYIDIFGEFPSEILNQILKIIFIRNQFRK